MKRYLIAILIVLLLATSTLCAKGEVWLGINFVSDTYKIYDYSRPYYDGRGTYGDINNLKNIISIAPQMDVIFFPSDVVRVGIIISSATFLTISYEDKDKLNGYKSYNFDNRQDFAIGVAYNQMFSSMLGMYANGKLVTGLNQIATTNISNSREDVKFNRYADFSYAIDLGLLAKNHNSYFKVGATYAHAFNAPLDKGYNIQMSIGGGLIF